METFAVCIQALASCVLIGVTWKYVCLTKRLVEETSPAFVALEEIVNPQIMGCRLKVLNYGPGHAIGLTVSVRLNSMTRILNNEDIVTEEVVARGPSVLGAGQEAIFEIDDPEYGIEINTLVTVFYSTTSGKKYKYQWERYLEGEPQIKYIGALE